MSKPSCKLWNLFYNLTLKLFLTIIAAACPENVQTRPWKRCLSGHTSKWKMAGTGKQHDVYWLHSKVSTKDTLHDKFTFISLKQPLPARMCNKNAQAQTRMHTHHKFCSKWLKAISESKRPPLRFTSSTPPERPTAQRVNKSESTKACHGGLVGHLGPFVFFSGWNYPLDTTCSKISILFHR